jgi:hypothetical protein
MYMSCVLRPRFLLQSGFVARLHKDHAAAERACKALQHQVDCLQEAAAFTEQQVQELQETCMEVSKPVIPAGSLVLPLCSSCMHANFCAEHASLHAWCAVTGGLLTAVTHTIFCLPGTHLCIPRVSPPPTPVRARMATLHPVLCAHRPTPPP